MRHLIRKLIMECPCMQNPGVRIEVEEDVVEPILDLIDSVMNKPSDSHSGMADAAAGRMFDYGHTKSDSREGRMTRSKLFRMGKMAQSFHDKLEDDDDLPQWVNDKVTTAEDRLRSAFEYMDYKLHRNKMQGKLCNESTVRSMARNYLRSVL